MTVRILGGLYGAKTAQELEKVGAADRERITGSPMGALVPMAEDLRFTLFAGQGLIYWHPGFFFKNRVLDGYLGILGVVLHYKLLAVYHDKLTVAELALRLWRWQVFSVYVAYDPWNRPLPGWRTPRWPVTLGLFRWRWSNWGKVEA